MTAGRVERDAASAGFLDGTARGEFLLRRCERCATVSEPSSQQCPACSSTELAWTPASGAASVVSWAVAHGRSVDGEAPPVTVLVIAELAEGPWWWSQLLDADPADVEIGMPLRIDFVARAGSETVPVFRAVTGGD